MTCFGTPVIQSFKPTGNKRIIINIEGIPGCGKSSILRHLKHKFNADVVLENEALFEELVNTKDGPITVLQTLTTNKNPTDYIKYHYRRHLHLLS